MSSLLRNNHNPARSRADSHVWRSSATVHRVRPKEHPRTRRRKRLTVLVALFVVSVGSIVGAIEWAAHHEAVRFSGADIRGTFVLPKPLVETLVDVALAHAAEKLIPTNNAMLFDAEALALQLQDTYPRIAHVDIYASSLIHPRLVVNVQERSPHALWCSPEAECYLMDARGIIFAHDTGEARAIQTVFYGGSIASSTAIGSSYAQGIFDAIKRILLLLNQRGMEVSTITANSPEEVVYQLSGFELRTRPGTDPSEVVSTLELVLSSKALRDKQNQLEYVDVRFGNRVYFKLRGEAEITNYD